MNKLLLILILFSTIAYSQKKYQITDIEMLDGNNQAK